MHTRQSRQALTAIRSNFTCGSFRVVSTSSNPGPSHILHDVGQSSGPKQAVGKWSLPVESQAKRPSNFQPRTQLQPSVLGRNQTNPRSLVDSLQRSDNQARRPTLPKQQFGLRSQQEINRQRSDGTFDRPSFNSRGTQPRSALDAARGPRVELKFKSVTEAEGRSAYRPTAAHNMVEENEGPDNYKALFSGNARQSGSKAKNVFKTRGSLISSFQSGKDIEIPSYSRTAEANIRRAKNLKGKQSRRKMQEVSLPRFISVSNLSQLLNVRIESLQSCMRRAGMAEESSYDHVLPYDYASLLAEEFGRKAILIDEDSFDILPPTPHPDPMSLPHRPPIVTIMGHVDHGKTTILDSLRSSSIAKNEAGGITQHIGAFSVSLPETIGSSSDSVRTITFLDTPGHAAFSAMRSRGAHVTDIVVLVVAADDGVMPQTKEVIELIKKEGNNIGVVVAINKIDKPGIDVGRIQSGLMAEGLELELMGGDIPCVEVSGLTGQGLDKLVETISVIAELRDLRAEREGPMFGYILEADKRKGIGLTATVLLLRGSLTPASQIIAGLGHAKVRQLIDSSGQTIRAAYPGMAVTVSGWKELPDAGDMVIQASEGDIKKALQTRMRKAQVEATSHDVDAINEQRVLHREKREVDRIAAAAARRNRIYRSPIAQVVETKTGPKELKLVVKGDVIGSVEALSDAVQGMGNKEVTTNVVFKGVGSITESDVTSAKAIDGRIVALSTDISREAKALAAQLDISIFTSSVIYDVIDEIRSQLIKLLPVIIEKKVTGEANVLQLFQIQGKAKKIIKVAGCRVINGAVEKNRRARVIRDQEIIYEGNINTLRYLKKDVTEIKKGLECGLSLESFDDIREGDLIQMYQEIEKPGQL